MKQPVVLKVYRGDALETVRQFEDSQIVIGREDVQLPLQGTTVSLLHAMIEERDGDYFVSDLGSQTGTFRNGQRVLEERLQSGDVLTIGGYRVQFFVGVPKAATPPPVNPLGSSETVVRASAFEEPVEKERTVSVFDRPFLSPEDTDNEITLKVQLPHSGQNGGPQNPPSPTTAKPRATPRPLANEVMPRASVFVAPSKSAKKRKTFAPPSSYNDARDIIKPGKGSVVEVLVLWRERVLNTYHFHEGGPVFIGGGPNANVTVPILSASSQYKLMQIAAGSTTIFVSPEMTGELIRDSESLSLTELARQNKLRNAGQNYEIDMRQGEMMRLGLQNNMISIMIRYKAETPKPAIAPLLDFSASETTGVILAGVISAIFALYMSLYSPSALMDDESQVEEPLRKAVVTFSPPHVEEAPETKPQPEKKKVIEVTEKKQSVLAENKPTENMKKKEASKTSVAKAGEPGKAGEVAPKKTEDKTKRLTSARPGGSIKTGAKEGANMKSDKPDPSKMGLLGVFSSKGTQSKLDQAYSGSGELQGMADKANGNAGSNENRAGDTMGTKLKDTGAGGKGTSSVGIAGLGTNGRGSGNTGYGTGGLGSKGSTRVDVGGTDAQWGGNIDKEAIRRVIRDHKNEIRFCYDKELQSHPGLNGKIRIGWNITETGAAKNVEATDNEMGNAAVASCIVNKLRTWGFPPAPSDMEAHVVYPFVFSAE